MSDSVASQLSVNATDTLDAVNHNIQYARLMEENSTEVSSVQSEVDPVLNTGDITLTEMSKDASPTVSNHISTEICDDIGDTCDVSGMRTLAAQSDTGSGNGLQNHDDVSSENVVKSSQFRFTVDKSPMPWLLPFYGFQQAFFGIAGALYTSILIAREVGASSNPEVRAEMLSLALFTSGLTIVMDVLVGSRLPGMFGPMALYVVPMTALFSSPKWSDGNLMLACATEVLIGITGALGLLLKFIGPLTMAPVLILIGVSLAEFMIPLCAQHWGIAVLSFSLMLLFSLFLAPVRVPIPVYTRERGCHVTRYPLFQLNPLMLTIGLSWITCHVLTVSNVLPGNATLHGHLARTDVRVASLYNSDWFTFPLPFKYGRPTVSLSGYIGMLVVNIAVTMELPGCWIGTAELINEDRPPVHAVNRGVLVHGLSGCIAAMVGGVTATVTYAQSLSLTAVTKIASRSVFVTAGFILIVMGVVSKTGVALSLIPDPIIGGVNLFAFGTLVSVGISMYRTVDLSSSRNLVIIGVSVMLGLKIPPWILTNNQSIQTGVEALNQTFVMLLSSSVFVSGFTACILDNLAPGIKSNKGVSKTLKVTSDVRTLRNIYDIPLLGRCCRKFNFCSHVPISTTFDADRQCSCCCRDKSKLKTEASFTDETFKVTAES